MVDNEEIVIPGCITQAREKFLSSSYLESFRISFPHKLWAAVWKEEQGTWLQLVSTHLCLRSCYHWLGKDWLLLEFHGNSATKVIRKTLLLLIWRRKVSQLNLICLNKKLYFVTWVILPNTVPDEERRRWGAIPAAPLALSVRWSNKTSVEVLDNQ